MAKELKSTLLLIMKSGLQELDPFKDELMQTLRDLGAGEQVGTTECCSSHHPPHSVPVLAT